MSRLMYVLPLVLAVLVVCRPIGVLAEAASISDSSKELSAAQADTSMISGDEITETLTQEDLTLLAATTEFSKALAMESLVLASGHKQVTTAEIMQEKGFEVVLQKNFDKAADDPAHTCAYSVGKREIERGDETRTLYVVIMRGTDAGEWYSNFDFAPSHSDETLFAENFLFAAQDVFLGLQEVVTEENPLFLAVGHSRGAACANLLGMLLNEQYGAENVYCYTAATPATVRGIMAQYEAKNIFNLINPADIVPMMPMQAWGYSRLGTDIILDGDTDLAQRLNNALKTMSALASTISSYYTGRHSLTAAGLSDDGLTVYEAMLLMAQGIRGSISAENINMASGLSTASVSDESDFAPLLKLLEKTAENDNELGKKLLYQHMPTTYEELLSKQDEK